MALHEQTEARLVGFDELAASVQIETLRAIESDLPWPCLPMSQPTRTYRAGISAWLMRIGVTREASSH